MAHAVVSLDVAGETPADYGVPNRVRQEDIAFHPHVLAVPLGAQVEFPNFDRVRHHVYSFAKGNRFELELYGREEHRTVTFDTPGTVAIGCNIHDDMLAYIRVIEAPFARVTEADGTATFDAFPEDTGTAEIWYPELGTEAPLTLPLEHGSEDYTIVLPDTAPRPAPPEHMK